MNDEENEPHSFEKKHERKFNIFDDDVTLEQARNIIKYSQIPEEDNDEGEINFDGTPVVKFNNAGNASKVPVPDLSALAVPVTSPASRSTVTPEEAFLSNSGSFGSVSSAMAFGHNRSKSLTIGNAEKGVPRPTFTTTPLSESSSLQDIDESLDGGLKKHPSLADIDKLQQEVLSLRRSLLGAKRDRWVKPPVDETLRRILKGEEYSLEMYRSLEDKLELLDRATHQHDGNAVTAAVLFLQRTVSRKIFNRELLVRPVAANHYLNYLKTHFDHNDYISTLLMLGRTEEAAIYKYKLALPTSDVTVKISKLRDSLRSHFQADPLLLNDSSLVQEYVDLLERQRPIEESDAGLEAAGKTTIFLDFPRKRSLLNMPVVTTLYYCCFYHFDLSENSLACPLAIRKRHQISDKQYVWTAIAARAKLRQWKDVEALLTTKNGYQDLSDKTIRLGCFASQERSLLIQKLPVCLGWFGGTKLKAVIGFDKVVEVLHRNNAPPDILDKYLSMIDNLEQRLTLSRKVSCSKAIVDTLVAMKNRAELEVYASKLDRYSKDGLYAHDVLRSSTIRWK